MNIDLAKLSKIQGFKIEGAIAIDAGGSGRSTRRTVSQAGDINGDGINDIILSTPNISPLGRQLAGESYVILGKKEALFNNIDLAILNNTQGFKILGANSNYLSGLSVNKAGDINNDNFDDVIISAWGESYVIFGKKETTFNNIDLLTFNNTQGFKILGAGGVSGGIGDINSDGVDDIIVGGAAQESYVIFGKNGITFNDVDLTKFNNTQGFKILGTGQTDLGRAGDINGDNIDDIIIGAPQASPLGRQYAGESYVIFGKKATIFNNIDLAKLDNIQGFKILGTNKGAGSGSSVNRAGDINGDNIDDIIIGAPQASPLGRNYAGESYVIFGKKATIFNDIDLAMLNNTQGFKIQGVNYGPSNGYSVDGAGDVNNDGIDDVIIGAPYASPFSLNMAGESYVIYGKKAQTFDDIDLMILNDGQGFKIQGANSQDYSGFSVSGAGDVNNDGIDDIIIRSAYASPLNRRGAGESYVIYGTKQPIHPTPWWEPYLEIGLPIAIGGVILTAGLTYGTYKYKQEGTICGYHIGNHESEQTHLINQAPVDSETWYT